MAFVWAGQAARTNMESSGQLHEVLAVCIPILQMRKWRHRESLAGGFLQVGHEGSWIGRWIRLAPKPGCDCPLWPLAQSCDNFPSESPSSFPPQALYTHCSLCQEL